MQEWRSQQQGLVSVQHFRPDVKPPRTPKFLSRNAIADCDRIHLLRLPGHLFKTLRIAGFQGRQVPQTSG
jgi:hypothetical protein